jgi:hypothetical protein
MNLPIDLGETRNATPMPADTIEWRHVYRAGSMIGTLYTVEPNPDLDLPAGYRFIERLSVGTWYDEWNTLDEAVDAITHHYAEKEA